MCENISWKNMKATTVTGVSGIESLVLVRGGHAINLGALTFEKLDFPLRGKGHGSSERVNS